MSVITRSAAALSWIDPQTGLPEVDDRGHPGTTTIRSIILGQIAYRFANFLEAEVEIDDKRDSITRVAITSTSGMYRSPSFMCIPSAPVGNIGRSSQIAGTSAIVRQIVGCRTVSSETIGTGVGAAVGAGGAVALGVCVIGTGGLGLVALGLGGLVVGALGGRETAEYAIAFPPIWSELELTINVNGTTSERLIAHSLFPTCTFYRQDLASGVESYREVSTYPAVPTLDRWKQHGWSNAPSTRSGPTSGNPWNMISGRNRLGGHTVNRPCPTSYTCH